MQLTSVENGFQIDAAALGPLLGVPVDDVQRLMRDGRIVSLYERGQDEDAGRHRITFRHKATRVRLTVNDSGEVLLRTRTVVAPRPGSLPLAEPVQADEADKAPEYADGGLADMAQRLEARFHPSHRQRLDQLGKLAEMIEDFHEDEECAPEGLHRILRRIGDVLDVHMRTAETVVFPAIRRGKTSELGPAIDALRGDHDGLAAACARIREISQNFQLPDGACTIWANLYADLAVFVDDLAEHMRLERDVIFPQLECGGVVAHG